MQKVMHQVKVETHFLFKNIIYWLLLAVFIGFFIFIVYQERAITNHGNLMTLFYDISALLQTMSLGLAFHPCNGLGHFIPRFGKVQYLWANLMKFANHTISCSPMLAAITRISKSFPNNGQTAHHLTKLTQHWRMATICVMADWPPSNVS